ncbi:16S rRNA (uracil(1498)-N(3))-methyltransferase [Alkalilacustris brevis]|uniref:16S rRNA (uracil(1498)-N(3))-methyltransferase n=1 Tax=Alkalilacustris brevis TaxID=2026338 RepID=UPI000E0D6438|nr:16S rRNA (uracil(1498)-N(3))-methyltransferase [Alkalilacustris brevis]
MAVSSKVRLYVDHPLGAGQSLPLAREQAHYLFNVMRLGPGDRIAVFNGRDEEWLAEVAKAGKRGGVLLCVSQMRPLQMPPDLWLLFAPIKKARTDFIVEKATEMGARRILPVQTDFTNAERIRRDRLQAHAIEAAEQCGGTFVPEVADLAPLDRVLAGWDAARGLWWADEGFAGMNRGADVPAAQDGAAASGVRGAPGAVLIGPEGGFSPDEQARLRALPFVAPVSLGPRILRADTAAVAALTRWQIACGDWT